MKKSRSLPDIDKLHTESACEEVKKLRLEEQSNSTGATKDEPCVAKLQSFVTTLDDLQEELEASTYRIIELHQNMTAEVARIATLQQTLEKLRAKIETESENSRPSTALKIETNFRPKGGSLLAADQFLQMDSSNWSGLG